MQKPTIAFFGTSELSIIVLLELEKAGLLPDIIIAPKDKPQGRKFVVTPPMTKEWARARGIYCIQPKSLKEIPYELTKTPLGERWDLFIVASYGKILPKTVLDLPSHGTLNVHPSLLPLLRGPAPIQGAILNDDKNVGVSIMLLDEEVDHGPILIQKRITPAHWPLAFETLHDLLAHAGGSLLASTIPLWLSGDITPHEQDHTQATYTKMIKKEDGCISLKDDPYQNYLKILAFSREPGTHFFITRNGKKMRVKIIKADFKNGELEIITVIPEGKKEMKYTDFKRSFQE